VRTGRSTPAAVLCVALIGLASGAAYAALAGSGGSTAGPKITAGPRKLTNQTSARFTYSSKLAVLFLCSLDGGALGACGSGRSGSTAYAGPLPDGPHRFDIEASAGTATSRPVTRTWTVDTLPPPLPVFRKKPPDSTIETKARFAYSDAESSVAFQCRLDGSPYTSCHSKKAYKRLALDVHEFCVRALDRAANTSTAACSTWLIGPGPVRFSIAGSPLPGALLYPGGAAVPINLIFTNPNPAPITVGSVTVSMAGTSAPGCDPKSFGIPHQLGATPIVPAGSTRSLQDLGVPQADWPQLAMAEAGNQDACQNAAVDLAYSGTATG
jgi:hypothetical protein